MLDFFLPNSYILVILTFLDSSTLLTKSLMKEQRKIKTNFKLSSYQDTKSYKIDLDSRLNENSKSKIRTLANKKDEKYSSQRLCKVNKEWESKELRSGTATKKERRSQKNLCVSAKQLKRRNERRSLNYR